MQEQPTNNSSNVLIEAETDSANFDSLGQCDPEADLDELTRLYYGEL